LMNLKSVPLPVVHDYPLASFPPDNRRIEWTPGETAITAMTLTG
jgi:hypothetical protein